MSRPALPPTPRLPWVVLGVMTLLTLGGPVAIGVVLRGGPRATWPPDRPVEWVAVLGISGMVLALMAVATGIAVSNNIKLARRTAARRAEAEAEQ